MVQHKIILTAASRRTIHLPNGLGEAEVSGGHWIPLSPEVKRAAADGNCRLHGVYSLTDRSESTPLEIGQFTPSAGTRRIGR
jgi:hypothetical protein